MKACCCLWFNLAFCGGFIILVYLVLYPLRRQTSWISELLFCLPVSPFPLKIFGIQNMFTENSWFCLKLVCQRSLRWKMRDFLERRRRESKYSSPLGWNYLYIIKRINIIVPNACSLKFAQQFIKLFRKDALCYFRPPKFYS